TIIAKRDGTILYQDARSALSVPSLRFLTNRTESDKEKDDRQIPELQRSRIRLVTDGPEYDVFARHIPLDPQFVQLPVDEVIVCGLAKVQGMSVSVAAEFLGQNILPLVFLAGLLCISRPVQRLW